MIPRLVCYVPILFAENHKYILKIFEHTLSILCNTCLVLINEALFEHPDHTYCPKEEYGETEFERAGKQTLIIIDRKAQQYLSFKGQNIIFWYVMHRKMPGFPAGQL